MALPPINLKEINTFPPQFKDWLRQLQTFIAGATGGVIPWSNVSKSGSNLNELTTRDHNDLTNKQGGTSGEFYHLTSIQNANQVYGFVSETGATHTVASTTKFLIADRAGTITVTLPTASSFTGRELVTKTVQAQTVVSASSNVVPLTGGAAGTAILAATAGKWAHLVSDGTNWVIMAAN